MKIVCVVVLIAWSVPTSACWQKQQNPISVPGMEVRGGLSYEKQPLKYIPLRLETSTGKLVATTRTGRYGEFHFKNLRTGNYSIVLVRPSSERINITITQAGFPPDAVDINFYGDWCIEYKLLHYLR